MEKTHESALKTHGNVLKTHRSALFLRKNDRK